MTELELEKEAKFIDEVFEKCANDEESGKSEIRMGKLCQIRWRKAGKYDDFSVQANPEAIVEVIDQKAV